jgi:DNA-directed RNA polymerase subunit RPC12/RpoP
MVVICPNCGREIFSDPDSCVMCGWRRDASQPREGMGERSVGPRRKPTKQRTPPPRYPRERYEKEYGESTRREPDYRAPREDYMDRTKRGYRGEEERYYEREPRGERRMDSRYPEYPQRRDQRQYYDERRRPPYQERSPGERPSPRRDFESERETTSYPRDRGREKPDRNYCPNCGSEIFTDPDNCVLCGWSRTQEERRPPPSYEPRRPYPKEQTRGYQERTYPKEQPRGYEERTYPMKRERGYQERTYPTEREPRYREAPRESAQRYPPEGWERQVEQRMRRQEPSLSTERRTWYKPEAEVRKPKKEGARDKFVCENCGNPSLQFFADGLGRCPGCGYRFRFSARPTTIRSKQKHKQFICSNCDGKNLQFFFDGRGICPHCGREFRWKK